MSLIFYDHLVDKREILLYLERLDAPENHKGKIKQLVDDIIHQGLVEFILQKLHPHHHHTFLARLHDAPFDPEIIAYLKDHASPAIESDLKNEANRLLVLIKKDLGLP